MRTGLLEGTRTVPKRRGTHVVEAAQVPRTEGRLHAPSPKAGPAARGHPAGAPRAWVGARLSAGWELQEQRRFGGEPGVVWRPPGTAPPQSTRLPGQGADGLAVEWETGRGRGGSGRGVCGGRAPPGESTLGGRQGQPATGRRERCGGRGARLRGREAATLPRPCCSEVTTGDGCAAGVLQAGRAQARVRVLQARGRGSQSA